jgi:hypothetical protein
MTKLIVIRIVPEKPVVAQDSTAPIDFTRYLSALGGLQIEAFALSFNSPSTGQSVGSAAYKALKKQPSPTSPVKNPPSIFKPTEAEYEPGTGIVQHIDLQAPSVSGLDVESAYYTFESVATAVIEIPDPPSGSFENLKLVAQWGSGSNAQTISIPFNYYDVALANGPAPTDLNTWLTLAPSLYLTLPKPPSASNPFSLQLPTDGTPPPFDALLKEVGLVLAKDPGSSTNVDLGTLSLDQCRNIAYEILWSQQPALPTPPDPGSPSSSLLPPLNDPKRFGDLYTNPPNNGNLLSGTNPNQDEGDRQQFEAQLKSYYSVTNASADRLTNYVYALSAAIACEQQSLAATQALLEFPTNPGQSNSAPSSETEVILTGINQATPLKFGVPSGYFYALTSSLPTSVTPQKRFTIVTSAHLQDVLSQLTSAINAKTITDLEEYKTGSVSGQKINAAQAARRIVALSIPKSSAVPLAPLDTVHLLTKTSISSGSNLSFDATNGVKQGMFVSGVNIPPGATVSTVNTNSVTLSAGISGNLPKGSTIVFTPVYSPELQSLIQSWLAFPPTPTGVPSSQSYQPSDDLVLFWPEAANSHPTEFLKLVLSALTQGFIIPAPFNIALGDKIEQYLATLSATPTVSTLASLTIQQWTAFFQQNPTWLPSQQGNTTARIAAFIQTVQKFFTVASGGQVGSINLATSVDTPGGTVLTFASTSGVTPGMSVSSLYRDSQGKPAIASGTVVAVGGVTATTVTLNQPVSANVPFGTNITFTPNIQGATASDLPQLQAPSNDWLTICLSNYNQSFMFGSGISNPDTLKAAAANVFQNDQSAQKWLVNAITTIDALYQIVNPLTSLQDKDRMKFSLVEALYARGFLSAADVTTLSRSDFVQAVIGTIAFDFADDIYASAISPPAQVTSVAGEGFKPINPDGSLTNCIPPLCLSPLGSVAYLSELLKLSELSTCDQPFPIPIPSKTLGTVLATRRGSLGNLAASGSNVSTPIPLIDIVNENLEFMAASDNPTSGTVYNTGGSLDLATNTDAPSGTVLSFSSTAGVAIGMSASSSLSLQNGNPVIPNGTIVIKVTAKSITLSNSVAGDIPSGTNITFAPSHKGDQLAGFILCRKEACLPEDSHCHDPATIYGALPEHSTPASPTVTNAAVVPPVYNKLKVDFSSCRLPYSQALDVNRTYLRHFRSCRYEEMRTFRKCITEFVLDPNNEPLKFEDYLWRYPVRIDTAIEYLGITPEEYHVVFKGSPFRPCVESDRRDTDASTNVTSSPVAVLSSENTLDILKVFGLTSPNNTEGRINVLSLPVFLQLTCLTYCEFVELWKSGFVSFRITLDEKEIILPDCEPCCLEKFKLQFTSETLNQDLLKLFVFIRLWHKLKKHCCTGYSFNYLRDICDVLKLFNENSINPEFIRQLAAFQMLQDDFQLELVDPCANPSASAIDADRTHLLALWVQPQATKWHWAVRQLVHGVERYACRRYCCERRHCDFVEFLASNLDALSRLAGFDPNLATDNWHALPTHTLRFAEVLAKLYASTFTVEEVLYLFTVDSLDSECLFPLQECNEALILPLDLPDDQHRYSLWHLRRKLLEVCVCEEDVEAWNWKRIECELQTMFGFAAGDILSLGEHFFPHVLKHAGYCVDTNSTRFFTSLQNTTAEVWNTPCDGPFQYNPDTQQLWTALPLTDTAVIAKLEGVHDFNTAEQAAVQDLYFQPRALLAKFALLFENFPSAEEHMIQEPSEKERWAYFRWQFTLCYLRCRIIAQHLTQHVLHVTGEPCSTEESTLLVLRKLLTVDANSTQIAVTEQLTEQVERITGEPCPTGEEPALLILRMLLADENRLATSTTNTSPSWENNDGTHPPVTWAPLPNGGAFAALLALVGTGLVGVYKTEGGTGGGSVVWRDVCGSLSAFGRERNRKNCPVPTVLPAMNAPVPSGQAAFVSVHNGLLQKVMSDTWIGGAQGFDVTWSGALLIDHEGHYKFWADVPESEDEEPDCDSIKEIDYCITLDDEEPDCDSAENRRWRVTLRRGSRTWTLLSHNWPNQEDRDFASVMLKRGAYDLTLELVQPTPAFSSADQVYPQHTGIQVTYAGPDSCDERVEIPHDRLFSLFKDQPLGQGISNLSPGAAAFLNQLYVGSLRDIRRTYQRAFKALLFTHRFALSAGHRLGGQSELRYMLEHKANFAGAGFYHNSGSSFFTLHKADFDFNYLPVQDNFYPPTPTQDQRVQPSPQRIQAMFDWWERIFDYTVIRNEVQHHCNLRLWHLFIEAAEKQPADPSYLLRQIGANEQHWRLDLRYYQGQHSPIYSVTSTDLEDDRWVVRVWHADRWLNRLQHFFAGKNITKARLDLWASDDPSAVVTGEDETGNANLLAFLCESAFENGEPRRYEDVRRLNDGLRVRARDALAAYLCNGTRVALPGQPNLHATSPRDLSDLLLLDVEAGVCEKSSRIDEAITAVQSFIRRARLGLEEPTWKINREFSRMWDREFATFEVWQAHKRCHLYKENWLEWSELDKARQVEAFRFLETNLKNASLSSALPGGLEWWPDEHLPNHQGLELAQQRQPTEMQVLSTSREGLNLIGTPERDARPSWLTAVSPYVVPQPNPEPPPTPRLTLSEPTSLAASNQSSASSSTNLPFWMQTAIRLGTRFYRIAAAGVPSSAIGFEPHKNRQEDCVNCCHECGCEHPAVMDEYYFWLVDSRYYDNPNLPSGLPLSEADDGYQFGFQDDLYDANQQQSAYWQDSTQLPKLLEWESLPIVRLAWCRVHNGEFQQPRRSHFGVPLQLPLQPGQLSDLTFEGRTADSLFFSVSNAVVPQGHADTSPPGFRFDLATASALVLPLVSASPNSSLFVGGRLPAYPYFIYNLPGTHLFPLSPFSPSLAIAQWLRTHCRFEAALKWYLWAFDLLHQDCTWGCKTDTSSGETNTTSPREMAVVQPPRREVNPQSACCDSADVSCAKAEQRAIILHYLETLKEWGHTVIQRVHSPEAFQQARVIFDAARMILGNRPNSVLLQEPAMPAKVSEFEPEVAPLNPRLLDLYDSIEDQLNLIHDCLSARRLRNGQHKQEIPYFGNTTLREGWRTTIEPCRDESEWCYPPSPYRFTFLIQKAMEYASKVQELGNMLLAAFEKGDAEYLASMRAGHEAELLTLGLDAKKDQWRDADWQIKALQKTKAVSQTNLTYYNNLIQNGLIGDETGYQDLTGVSIELRYASNTIEGASQAANSAGNFFTGGAGFGGSPLIYDQPPIGQPLGSGLAAAARIMNSLAEAATSTAGLLLTEAGWQRRSDEWLHQTQILTIEIQQIERQILGAQRRRDQLLVELNSYQRQIEQSAEVQNFLRDKFSAHDLYLFLQRETAVLYYRTYELALYAARQAEQAFNLERGHTTRHFIPEGIWDNLYEGLMAGERLSTALRHMEKAYLDENIREYELTKHLSLRLNFPLEFLRLRTTGYCEIDIPEWMFDQNFPGQYMRRIKNVSLTLPCVTGPYTGVHCRLTLISSVTRIDPRLSAPAHDCCCPPKPQCCGDEKSSEGYQLCPDDPRMVKFYGAREAIATSGGQNDSGMFELSFNDPRYLPFEYMGAISRWRIELPPENNYFDLNTLTDAILHLNYTAREGGETLRNAAIASVRHKLPGDGWSFFDVRHDFPDVWERFRHSHKKEHPVRDLTVKISRKFLPFLPGDPEIRITKFVLLFEAEEMLEHSCPEIDACPCPDPKVFASHIIKFNIHREQEWNYEEKCFTCYATSEWPKLFSGMIGADLHPFGKHEESCNLTFGFPGQLKIAHAYLFCHYQITEECCSRVNTSKFA